MSDYELELYEIIGSMLKEVRLDRGMTLEQVAENFGVIPKTIQRYESGERKISIDKLMELTTFYGVDYSHFMAAAEKRLSLKHPSIVSQMSDDEEGYYFNDEVAEIAQQVYDRPELRMLFSASKNVSADDLQAVIALVERMKKEDD